LETLRIRQLEPPSQRMGLAFYQVWCLWILQITLNQVFKDNRKGHLLIIIWHSSTKMKREKEFLAWVKTASVPQVISSNPRSRTINYLQTSIKALTRQLFSQEFHQATHLGQFRHELNQHSIICLVVQARLNHLHMVLSHLLKGHLTKLSSVCTAKSGNWQAQLTFTKRLAL